jgi:hypothetical protein
VVAVEICKDEQFRDNPSKRSFRSTRPILQRFTTSLPCCGGTDQARRAADAAGATLASNSQKLQEKAASSGASVSNRATDLRDEGVRTANSTAATVRDIASGATSVGQRAIGTSTDAGLDAAGAVRDRASDFTERAGKTIFKTIEQNPLMVAGVGLIVGGLIASALPRSEIEGDLIGDASTAVKRRAETAASQGFNAARNAIGEVCEQTARQAGSDAALAANCRRRWRRDRLMTIGAVVSGLVAP